MSQSRFKPTTQIGPNDPPPQEEPTHDVPVYPEQDPPLEAPKAIQAAEGEHKDPNEGEDDVDDDDLDPQAPHSPPDLRPNVTKERVVFDENEVAG